jgi:hypothetical protein
MQGVAGVLRAVGIILAAAYRMNLTARSIGVAHRQIPRTYTSATIRFLQRENASA